MSKDPLLIASPDAQRELFSRMCREASGFTAEDVAGAAINILINAIRQAHGKRSDAERRYDELMARMKGVLMDHYDAGGRKKGIFPFNQNIVVPLFDTRNRNQPN